MTTIVRKIVAVHRALDGAGLPHAFGGALALAWCTEQARGTIDIDVNVFVDASESRRVAGALPKAVARSDAQLAALERDGQVRLWWDRTPVDVFLDTTAFHRQVVGRCRRETFGGTEVPAAMRARLPQTRDLLLTLFTSKTFDDIRTPEGKQQLREEIIARVNQVLDRDLAKAVYFTEFIVQ